MVTYLDILNRARARQGSTAISSIAIGNTSGDSLQGVQALNKAISIFYDNSFDLDSDERATDITATPGTGVLSAPTDTWDTNVIKAVKYVGSGDDFTTPMTLITLEQAEEYKLKTFGSNTPMYWYVNQSAVYILPVPTSGYTIKVFYQKIYPDVTVDNINNTVVLPTTALNTLVMGVYAYLREQIGDPQWMAHEKKFEQQVLKFYQRNKHTYKRKGFRLFRVKANMADYKL